MYSAWWLIHTPHVWLAQVAIEKKDYEGMLQKAQAQQRPRAASAPSADSGY